LQFSNLEVSVFILDQIPELSPAPDFTRHFLRFWAAYYIEIGRSGRISKELIIGELFKLAMRLAEDRKDYKAADALLKLAKSKAGSEKAISPAYCPA
jgi:hypothetical protein